MGIRQLHPLGFTNDLRLGKLFSKPILPSRFVVPGPLGFSGNDTSEWFSSYKSFAKLTKAKEARPTGKMTRSQAIERYDAIDTTKAMPSAQWPGSKEWIVKFKIPDVIIKDPNYHWTVRGKPVTSIYTNRDLVPLLDTALKNLQQMGLLKELDTYNGSWVIRQTRGGSSMSAHSWGIAIDINAANNGLGAVPTMSSEFVSAFTKAGFTWGGNWKRADGMHFSLGF